MWIAGPKDCGEERCPIDFASKEHFVEGTFDYTNDICFVNTTVDEGCSSANGCYKKRKGLCSLAPANSPRTPLPMGGSCPPVETGSSGWIYPDYPWTQEGTLGEVINCF